VELLSNLRGGGDQGGRGLGVLLLPREKGHALESDGGIVGI
jgi:hypothetical protein